MNKKGFTLVEILGIIIIMVTLSLLIIPNVVNRFSSKKNDIDRVNTQLILDAAKFYVEDNPDIYIKEKNAKYCIDINSIKSAGYLDNSGEDIKTQEDVLKTKTVKVIYENKFNYELINKEEC